MIDIFDVLDTLKGEPHIIREIIDTLRLRKKIDDERWTSIREYYGC